MLKEKRRKFLHKLFLGGIFIKGIDGILETIGGTALFFVKSKNIVRWVQNAFHHELAQDPHDVIANHLIRMAHHLSHNTLIFTAIYLTIHGLIKIGLVIALLYKKLWAYPLAGIILTLFIGYELFRYTFTHSFILLFLIIIDILIVILLRIEYNVLKEKA